METTYIIIGGGQKVKQCLELNQAVVIEKRVTDYSEKSNCEGQNMYTNIWASYLHEAIDMAKEWVSDPSKLKFKKIEK